ncbi:LuxE/PaaK family acyltransferase [Ruegeria arenilitoris]|uniref:LuxE/PaaK family acyltransferase n=1 Tax=Ruegeria arenilitoris TaxID=1173585 RepID=UPI001C983EE3|nr:hypothetical protein [Ruegeria arenilitoris]MBY6081858.1 hypothetical protein [Ruegeria arenilitoris]
MLLDDLNRLTAHHIAACKTYGDYVRSVFGTAPATNLAEVPFLPVRAFKDFALRSVPEADVYKTMRSSGTSGAFSQIFLDKETARLQTLTLVDSFADTFGKGRFPMLVIDAASTVEDRTRFSARTAAINGFSMFSRKRCFALNDDLTLDLPRIRTFLDEAGDKPVFVFGFTFLIWQALVKELRARGETLAFQSAFVLHGGGWKKLEAEKVAPQAFKDALAETTGCTAVHNYYGMVEQTGTIFLECEHGRMHAGARGAALTRSPETHAVLKDGETGLLQVFSAIQRSYPGHALLTEDVGRTFAGTTCPCGRPGTIVEVDGRLALAEVRGCSDAYS